MAAHRHEGGGEGCAPLVRALSEPATYPGRPRVAVHETHTSWVFVTSARTYKIKKPVDLGFLDYSTLADRRLACQDEVRVNQALAPGIYLGVRAIVRRGTRYELVGADAADAVEFAVEMRTFDERDTLAGLIAGGALEGAHIEATARRLAGFHATAPVAAGWGPERVLAQWTANLEDLRRTGVPSGWRLDVPTAFGRSFVEAHREHLNERAAAGLARDGHGDLRCEHVLARPFVRIVDRIEFDPQLRRIDVACDLAFLAMDLEARGQAWAAAELFAAYERAGGARTAPELRSFYAAYRALVRVKVELLQASPPGRSVQAEALWSLSAQLRWRARGALVLIVCGPPATGKSTLARALGSAAEIPVVSSDAARKRLAGIDPHMRAGPEHYSPTFTRATYAQLAGDARERIERGGRVIVDATCRRRELRALLVARLPATRTVFIRCEAPLEVALERSARRLEDPLAISDATPEVVERLSGSFEDLVKGEGCEVIRVQTGGRVDGQVAAVELGLDGRR